MRSVVKSGAFKKDYKRIKKRGLSPDKLIATVSLLLEDQPLPERCRPHKLSGEYSGFWECHIEPDWLLIYDITDDELSLRRTGSHADLFK